MQLMYDHDPMDETTPVTVHLPDHTHEGLVP
jgi:hypothetical protein